MSEPAAVPFEAVLAKLTRRIAEDAMTIAVLQVQLDEARAGAMEAPSD